MLPRNLTLRAAALAACCLLIVDVDTAAAQAGWFGHADYLYLTASGPDVGYTGDQSGGMPNGNIYKAGTRTNSGFAAASATACRRDLISPRTI